MAVSYVIPAYLFMSAFAHKQPAFGIYLRLSDRVKMLNRLFDADPEGNMSIHRRFFLVNNIAKETHSTSLISGWRCGTVGPARILVVPQLTAMTMVKNAFDAVLLFRDEIAGVRFFVEGDEAGVFSTELYARGQHLRPSGVDNGIH